MERLYEQMLDVMLAAGRIMTSPLKEDIETSVQEKSGDLTNLVTKYDVAVQKYIITELTRLVPDAYFFAEEKDNDPEGVMSEYCFIIDPIDGTTNFVHGYKFSCISVALVSRGKVVFGAIYEPYLDEMFTAVLGGGAYMNGERISVANRTMPHAVIAIGTAPYYKSVIGKECMDLMSRTYGACIDVRRSGSAALDLCYAAIGRTDAFCEPLLSPWDFAAGMLIVSEAGGVVTDDLGAAPDLSAKCPIIAASRAVYDEFISIVRTSFGGKSIRDCLGGVL